MFLTSLVVLINNAIGAYIFVLIARVVLSWLIGFGILNESNKLVSVIHTAAAALIDPVLDFLKKHVPFLVVGAVDLSPVALYLLAQVVQIGLLSLVM